MEAQAFHDETGQLIIVPVAKKLKKVNKVTDHFKPVSSETHNDDLTLGWIKLKRKEKETQRLKIQARTAAISDREERRRLRLLSARPGDAEYRMRKAIDLTTDDDEVEVCSMR